MRFKKRGIKNIYLGEKLIGIQFDDPVVHSVVEYEFGGWDLFSIIPKNEENKKRWVEAYKKYAKEKNHPKYLPISLTVEGIKQIGRTREIKKLKE